ncbi:MAG: hypothetical protein LBG87_01155 [Spirochaetaceae bacterium]|nr:hypothetical protein [Spirochaetaceae bacterium]
MSDTELSAVYKILNPNARKHRVETLFAGFAKNARRGKSSAGVSDTQETSAGGD